MFRFSHFVLAGAIAAAFFPASAGALELGEISSRTALGQSLDAQIELRSLGDLSADEIKVALAPQQAFDRLGLDRSVVATGLSFSAEVGRNGRGVIRVKSSRPMREPYLDFLVQVAWPQGQVLREYTLLLDPPSYVATSAAPTMPISTAVSSGPALDVPQGSASAAVIRQPTVSRQAGKAQSRAASHRERKPQLNAARKSVPAAAPAVAAKGDSLHLVSGQAKASSKAPDAATAEHLALAQEGLESARRQGDELKSRIADLQGQVDKLNQLVTLKDAQMAELVARLAERNRQAASAPAAKAGPVAVSAVPTDPKQVTQ
ncbi:type IV pilus assembly protein FimV [Pseudomonas knackmussii]|uniref:type IV pilus assembly protein FimV n=1 Tax=Pseudomonas knackmussii TaxID=65741 RepID=UPI00136261CF|nr:hypothetical protein [Pseudomonas knackmussii]